MVEAAAVEGLSTITDLAKIAKVKATGNEMVQEIAELTAAVNHSTITSHVRSGRTKVQMERDLVATNGINQARNLTLNRNSRARKLSTPCSHLNLPS